MACILRLAHCLVVVVNGSSPLALGHRLWCLQPGQIGTVPVACPALATTTSMLACFHALPIYTRTRAKQHP
ncbi:hypothetical protein B0T11DRAFT_278243 [Plectosphaerella cucumerina]|uniref:Secreted protein n=1 Tax=Plectosphaerella cucumerina TaxID=40658 RepID=A0A8K0X6Q0_9PEZI|nr:hypothetical protein B0T11DRAFT_278243 [Plectosphaerella cucumerina]